jgi:2-dehydropantoate 2-reductase
MGQVPMNKTFLSSSPTYGIIGDGRVAQHMAHYFRMREIPFKVWSRKLSAMPVDLELLEQDVLLLLLRDSAIENFIEQNPDLQQKTLVHFSGSLVTDKAFGAHPLMTFGKDLYDLETYERIPFICEAGRNEGDLEFQTLFPRLKNPSHPIHISDKARYHALCVMSQNFTTLLWQKFFRELPASFQIDAEAGKPILEQTLINLLKDPSSGLTGPIARGDAKTIKANLESLRDDPYHDVYEAFVAAWTKEQKNLLGSPTTKEISQ